MSQAFVLGIDSSASQLFLCAAVSEGAPAGSVVRWSEAVIDGENSHEERFTRAIDELLREVGGSFEDCAELVVGSGPGSFTGLRIALAFAKGVSIARGIPVSLECSFAAAAQEFLVPGVVVAVVSAAGRGELFCGVFRGGGEQGQSYRIILAPEVVPPAGLRERVALLAAGEDVHWVWHGAGSGSDVFSSAQLPQDCWSTPRHVARGLLLGSRTEQAWKAVLEQFQRAEFRASPGWDAAALSALEPQYVREVAAKTIAERAAGAARG